MNRSERSQLVAEIEARLLRRLAAASVVPATVIDAPTTSDPQVGVLVDTADPAVVGSDDDDVVDVEYGQIVGDPPAVGERVMVRYRPGGGMEVDGTVGGAWRLLGGAVVPGGATNQQNLGSNTEQAITGLEVEVDVPRPNRWVEITVHARIGADVAAGSNSNGAGRVYREDYDADGNVTATTLIGFWYLKTVRSFSTASGEVLQGSVIDVAPETGVCRYYATAQVTAGFTVAHNPTSVPAVSAFIEVVDRGPAPEDVDLPA